MIVVAAAAVMHSSDRDSIRREDVLKKCRRYLQVKLTSQGHVTHQFGGRGCDARLLGNGGGYWVKQTTEISM